MMSAYTLTDALSFSHLNALPTVYRSETANQPRRPQSLNYLVIGYTAGSALTTAPQHFGRWEDMLPNYQPKTELGEKLLALRRTYRVAGCCRLTSWKKNCALAVAEKAMPKRAYLPYPLAPEPANVIPIEIKDFPSLQAF